MARCDQGYLCDVCGEEVEIITDSDLYLRYILGEVPPEKLTSMPERHLRCNPALAQFICAEEFPVVACPGVFAKTELDGDFVRSEEQRITAAWHRLQSLPTSGLAVTEYPWPEVRARWGN